MLDKRMFTNILAYILTEKGLNYASCIIYLAALLRTEVLE